MNDATAQPIDLLAGIHPNGQPVFEQVPALALGQHNRYRLLQSPLFVNGVASGDVIELMQRNPGRFRMCERSGLLAVRVLCRDGVAALAEELVPALEKLDATLDVQSERALVFSIHVAVGFSEIEQVLEPLVQAADATWSYGNVYDTDSGAPLDWWEQLLNP
jgi:hypothetical protein